LETDVDMNYWQNAQASREGTRLNLELWSLESEEVGMLSASICFGLTLFKQAL
jgi:hypothetical protein